MKCLFCLVLMLMFCSLYDCKAQWVRQRSVFFESNLNLQNEGTVLLSGVGYDFRLKPGAFEGFGLKLGLSYGTSSWLSLDTDVSYRSVSLLGGANWLIMPEKNGLETGLSGRVFLYPGTKVPSTDITRQGLLHERFGGFLIPSIAYRFQPYHYGLSFRVEYAPYIGFVNNSWAGFGVSVGYLLF